ncbi:hypothetical protein SAMN05428981_11061 [Bacillus sp. OV194]|nr:hypothetical protein SAMN05428981_11061 [Bacillus sp. OV194]
MKEFYKRGGFWVAASPIIMVLLVIGIFLFVDDNPYQGETTVQSDTDYSDDYSVDSSDEADVSTDSTSDDTESTEDEDTSYDDNESTDTANTSSDDSAMASYTGSDWAYLSFDDKFITVQTIIDAMESGGTKVSADAYWFIDALNAFYGDGNNDATSSEKVVDVISMSGVAGGVISN